MTRIFSGPLYVHYAQAYLTPAGSPTPDMLACFAGQANGLCGAALAGRLFLVTGLHTGHVGLTVDILDSAPSLEDSWEEAAEVSFTATTSDLALVQWAATVAYPLPLSQGSYRARYCARDMQRAREIDTSASQAQLLDCYALTLWPASPTPDEILRVTAEVASYHHMKVGGRGRVGDSADARPR